MCLCPNRCIEIGSGSGYVICSIALLLDHHGIRSHCIAVDNNPAAVRCSQVTLAAHKVCSWSPVIRVAAGTTKISNVSGILQQVANVDLISCDLLQPLLQRLQGKVDLLVGRMLCSLSCTDPGCTQLEDNAALVVGVQPTLCTYPR